MLGYLQYELLFVIYFFEIIKEIQKQWGETKKYIYYVHKMRKIVDFKEI